MKRKKRKKRNRVVILGVWQDGRIGILLPARNSAAHGEICKVKCVKLADLLPAGSSALRGLEGEGDGEGRESVGSANSLSMDFA